MVLPASTETPRRLALRKIVEEAGPEQMLGWAKPIFGEITHIYSTFDFILRYTAETMDKQGMSRSLGPGRRRSRRWLRTRHLDRLE
ncbi:MULTISPECIES: hypothetical protein [unclassified Bradyrhizobium]|uniref:hypothetical protein n=1 Tax=unclassified Bradyrhizobium TaxID=2631580 RepID=UPI003398B981